MAVDGGGGVPCCDELGTGDLVVRHSLRSPPCCSLRFGFTSSIQNERAQWTNTIHNPPRPACAVADHEHLVEAAFEKERSDREKKYTTLRAEFEANARGRAKSDRQFRVVVREELAVLRAEWAWPRYSAFCWLLLLLGYGAHGVRESWERRLRVAFVRGGPGLWALGLSLVAAMCLKVGTGELIAFVYYQF